MEFPSNSKHPNPKTDTPTENDKAPVEKVVLGDVALRKKGLGARMMNVVEKTDPKEIVTDVSNNVVVPLMKDLIFETVSQTLQQVLFGRSSSHIGRVGRNVISSGGPKINYNGITSQGSSVIRNKIAEQQSAPRSSADATDLLYSNRMEAQAVLDRMSDLMETYERVSVADMFNASGVTPNHMDYKWGWLSMIGFDINRVNGGYVIRSPRPVALP